MPKQTYIANTSAGAWTTVVEGEATIASLVANATASTTLAALRLKLANGTSSHILPMNSLPFNTPSRLAVGGISLKTGDKLEAMSNDAVDWVATAITGEAYSSAVVASPGTEAWTQLIAGPATVRGVFVSASSATEVGVRLHKPTQDASIVLSELITAGGSKRLMIPIVLGVGDSLQVKGDNTAFWIATGVTAA